MPKVNRLLLKIVYITAAGLVMLVVWSGQASAATSYSTMSILRHNPGVSGAQLDDFIRHVHSDSPFLPENNGGVSVGQLWVNAGLRNSIDPVYLMAHACVESAWGRDQIAPYNIYGYGAYDSDPEGGAYHFTSYQDCIDKVSNWIRVDYLESTGSYYTQYGPTLRGMNVYYATSQTWRNTICSIMNGFASGWSGYDWPGFPSYSYPSYFGDYYATITPLDIQNVMVKGQQYATPVNVVNDGLFTWPAGTGNPVHLGYRWVNNAGVTVSENYLTPDLSMNADLWPGGSTTFMPVLTAPSSPGTYTLVFDMAHVGVTWFSWKFCPTRDVSVTVMDSSQYQADFLNVSLPSTGLLANNRYTTQITVKNTGTFTWPASGANPVHIGYRWKNMQGLNVLEDYAAADLSLPRDIAPGETTTINFALKAPPAPGSYALVLDMARVGMTWFSWQGAATRNYYLSVRGDYKCSMSAGPIPDPMLSGETYPVSLTATNLSQMIWPAIGNNPVHLGYRWLDSAGRTVLEDYMSADLALAADVAPGGSATFNCNIKAPPGPGVYTLVFDLAHVGFAWFSWQGAATYSKTISVNDAYGVTYISVMAPSSVKAGSLTNAASVLVRNTGAITWSNSGANPVRLGYRWLDASGSIVLEDYLAADLALPVSSVLSGGTALFNCNIKTPSTPGMFTLVFDLAHVGVTWFSWQGAATWSAPVVVRGDYRASLTATAYPPVNVLASNTDGYSSRVTAVNDGLMLWRAGGPNPVHIGYRWLDAAGRTVKEDYNGADMALSADVAPGHTGIFDFRVKVPSAPGTYTLVFDLAHVGLTWFSWQGAANWSTTIKVNGGYGVSFNSVSAPLSVVAGTANNSATVAVANTGSLLWRAGGSTPVHLGYRWLDAAGRNVLEDYTTVPSLALTTDITNGNSATFNFNLRAPAALGNYTLVFDMAHVGKCWFSWMGAATYNTTVKVNNGYGVTFDSVTAPASIAAGPFTSTALVTVTNTGGSSWSSGGSNPIRLGYRWLDAGGRNVLEDYTTLPDLGLVSNLPVGNSVTFNVARLKVPVDPGLYTLVFDMAEVSRTWFSWMGAATYNTTVKVNNGYGVQFNTVTVPSSVAAGSTTNTATVNVTNTGGMTWSAGGANPVRLGYRWIDAYGRNVLEDYMAADLNLNPSPVSIYGVVAFTPSLKAPSAPGNYTLAFDMAQVGVTWFSWQGADTRTVAVQVN